MRVRFVHPGMCEAVLAIRSTAEWERVKRNFFVCPEPGLPNVPGKPVAHDYGLLWLYYELLWGVVAYYLGYLAFQM